MQVTLGFGKQNVELDIKDENLLGILMPNEVEALKTGQDEVRRAMENPISSARLKDVVKAGEKVAIITSDITRPMPGKIVLPVVLEELNQAGVADSDIQVIFALGSHRKHTVEEMKYLVGETVYGCR